MPFLRAAYVALICLLGISTGAAEMPPFFEWGVQAPTPASNDTICRDPPGPDRCQTFQDNCYEASYIPYRELYYCQFSESVVPWSLVFVVWMMLIFILLGTTAEGYFVDAIESFVEITHMPQAMAGVTILAFGNGSPEVFVVLGAFTDDDRDSAILGITSLIGSGIFITCIVIAAINFSAPKSRMGKGAVIRDIVCLILVLGLFYIVFMDGTVSLVESLSFLVVYIAYVSFVVLSPTLSRFAVRKGLMAPSAPQSRVSQYSRVDVYETDNEEEEEEEPIPIYEESIDLADGEGGVFDFGEVTRRMSHNYHIDEPAEKKMVTKKHGDSLVGDFQAYVAEVCEEFKSAGVVHKVILVVIAPFTLARSLTIPLVEHKSWNKFFCLICCWASPPFTIYFLLHMWDAKVFGAPIWAVGLGVSLVLFLVVLFLTERDHPPKYRMPFAICGLFMSVVWIYTLAHELVDVMLAFGALLNISTVFLGLTVLSWGNCSADLVASIKIASEGAPRMAIAGGFACPTFNTLVGLGIALMAYNANSYPEPFRFQGNIDVPVSLGFFWGGLVLSLIILPCTGYRLSKGYGIAMLGFYCCFLIVTVLMQLGILGDPEASWN